MNKKQKIDINTETLSTNPPKKQVKTREIRVIEGKFNLVRRPNIIDQHFYHADFLVEPSMLMPTKRHSKTQKKKKKREDGRMKLTGMLRK